MDRIEFTEALKKSIAEKTDWLNATELPKMLESYRLLHTCVHNLYDMLVKRALITPDPYKLEKKISTIQAPADSPYIESERALVIGSRFSDYETMLDFICTYFKFSVENLDLPKIKKLIELNNSFQWTNMSMNNTKTNTRGLAVLINEARQNLPAISLSLLNDSLAKSSQSITEITRILKDLTDFKREEYKLKIRIDILQNPRFSYDSIHTPAEEVAEIKKKFSELPEKIPFYSELINQISEEDFSEEKDALQLKTLELLKVRETKVEKTKESVNTKGAILDTIHILSTLSPTYSLIAEKLSENCKILEGTKNTLMNRIKRFFRKAFNIKEKPIIYRFLIEDKQKMTKVPRDVDISFFISGIERKSHFLGVIGNAASPEYKKIASSAEDAILQFVNKQISDNKETLALLTAADDYFKSTVPPQNRSKIKGLKIDLVTVNNAIVKANKKRAEYVAYIEEINQMKKLGIKDE